MLPVVNAQLQSQFSVEGKEKTGAVTSTLMKAACGYPVVLLINIMAILLMRSLLIVKEQVEVIYYGVGKLTFDLN